VFVDDTGNADTRDRILQAIRQSVIAACVVFGFPDERAVRKAPINDLKWKELVTFFCAFFGFIFETRRMVMHWPRVKRERLASRIEAILDCRRSKGPVPIRMVSQALGLLGTAVRIRMDHTVRDCITRRWLRGIVVVRGGGGQTVPQMPSCGMIVS
jgi:hypothetical protein